MHEMNERKALERKLRRYEQIVAGTDDFLAFIDADFIYQEINPAYLRAFGKRREEIVGNTGAALFGQEVFETVLKPVQERCLAGEHVSYAAWLDFPILGRRYMDVHYTPFREAEGSISGMVVAVRDITTHKRAEEQFRLLSEAIPQQVWTAQPDGSLDYVNQRTLDYFQRSFDEMIAWGWQNMLHPDDVPVCLDRWTTARETSQPYEIEFRLLRGKDRTYRWHLGRALPIFDDQGCVVRWFGTNTDVTEFKQLEATLRQTQKMEAIGTLAGGIAHDFNNVLMAILGYVELAQRKANGNDALSRDLKQITVAAKRAAELVQQILTFSRQTEQVRRPLDMQVVVKEVLSLLRATFLPTIEIRESFAAESAIVLGDPIQLHQVTMNLCMNAEYAMRDNGGVLEVALDSVDVDGDRSVLGLTLEQGRYIRLTVKDTGKGIDAAITQRIFDPFFTTKAVGEGTGMGLAVVHGIVTGMGGGISVDSELGKGSTFAVYFPEAGTHQVEEQDEESDEEAFASEGRVLFVEDEEALVKLGKERLEKLGFEVSAYTNSREALEEFRVDPGRYAVVITDQTMPGMSGDVLARELLQIRPDVPIILCTGFSHTMTAEKAAAIGIRAFRTKPLSDKQLAQTLREVLNPNSVM